MFTYLKLKVNIIHDFDNSLESFIILKCCDVFEKELLYSFVVKNFFYDILHVKTVAIIP